MKKALFVAAAATALATLSAPAQACDPIPGALIFGGIGAAIGNAPGAAIGAILGSAITGSAPCYGRYGHYERRYAEGEFVDRSYADRGYDRGYDRRYEPAYDRGYYEPAVDRVYERRQYVPAYRPAPVYYGPSYYAPPVVVYRSPKYYEPRYRHARHSRYDDRRYWR